MVNYLDDNVFESDKWVLQMLYYDIIDLRQRYDPAKSNNSKEGMVSHYWYFNHGFKFQNLVYNGFHDFTILCIKLSSIAIITV